MSRSPKRRTTKAGVGTFALRLPSKLQATMQLLTKRKIRRRLLPNCINASPTQVPRARVASSGEGRWQVHRVRSGRQGATETAIRPSESIFKPVASGLHGPNCLQDGRPAEEYRDTNECLDEGHKCQCRKSDNTRRERGKEKQTDAYVHSHACLRF